MLGEFQLETSEGFEDYLYEIGINWFNRKIACTLYPTTKEVNLLKLINCPGLNIKHSPTEDIWLNLPLDKPDSPRSDHHQHSVVNQVIP